MQRFKCPNIISFFGVVIERNLMMIVMELAECNLADILKDEEINITMNCRYSVMKRI